jgi:hypothetical protein
VEESLRLYQRTEDHVGVFYQLSSMGALAFLRGNYDQVKPFYTGAFDKFLERDLLRRVVGSLITGLVSLRRKRWKRARDGFVEGVTALRGLHTPWGNQCRAACLAGLAEIALVQGSPEAAARLLGAAESHITGPFARLAWGIHLGVTPTLVRKEYERIAAEIRSAMGGAAAAAVAEGRALSLEEAVPIGLAAAGDRSVVDVTGPADYAGGSWTARQKARTHGHS